MNELSTKSLAQIVNDNYRAAAVFEKYGLDFCCKGKRSLEQACTERSLPVDELLSALTAGNDSCQLPVDFNTIPLTQLADHIVATHHAFVKKEMPLILGYLQKVATKHGDRHPEMVTVFSIFSKVKQEMEEHMQKEELILFPRIKEVEDKVANGGVAVNVNYLQLPVGVMEAEHEQAGKWLNDIRELTNHYTAPADACTTLRLSIAALQAFEEDLHRHVHLENNILFPRAIGLVKATGTTQLN